MFYQLSFTASDLTHWNFPHIWICRGAGINLNHLKNKLIIRRIIMNLGLLATALTMGIAAIGSAIGIRIAGQASNNK